MKITLVPSSTEPSGVRYQFLTSYLINDTVAIDAGCIGLYRGPDEQAQIKHVFLTHSHIDHVASLPIFLENVFADRTECPTVYAGAAALDSLRQDLLNDRVWPDFVALSRPEARFLNLQLLEPYHTVEVAGLRLTPVPVNHAVPTYGFVVTDGTSTVVFPSDTGPTDAIWEQARSADNLKAVFLEATFPNEMAWLADLSKHHTPASLARDLAKLQRPTRVVFVHLKPRYHHQVAAELTTLGLTDMVVGESGRSYHF